MGRDGEGSHPAGQGQEAEEIPRAAQAGVYLHKLQGSEADPTLLDPQVQVPVPSPFLGRF